jgi:hypothetical protein
MMPSKFTSVLLGFVFTLALVVPASAEGAHLHIPYAPQSWERTWFSLAELEDAMTRYGYPPAEHAGNTWCELHEEDDPAEVGRRFSRCYLNLGEESGGATVIVFWCQAGVGMLAGAATGGD